jgi:3-dehydroquinate synthase
MMKTLEVDLGSRSYPIYIGAKLIDQPFLFSACEKATSIYIVTNTTVAPLYAEPSASARCIAAWAHGVNH